MISHTEYKFLKSIKKGGIVHDAGLQAYERQLFNDGFIEMSSINGDRLNICRLTPTGERAITEYKRQSITNTCEFIGIAVAIVFGILGIVL